MSVHVLLLPESVQAMSTSTWQHCGEDGAVVKGLFVGSVGTAGPDDREDEGPIVVEMEVGADEKGSEGKGVSSLAGPIVGLSVGFVDRYGGTEGGPRGSGTKVLVGPEVG